jgi:hypothetical protein
MDRSIVPPEIEKEYTGLRKSENVQKNRVTDDKEKYELVSDFISGTCDRPRVSRQLDFNITAVFADGCIRTLENGRWLAPERGLAIGRLTSPDGERWAGATTARGSGALGISNKSLQRAGNFSSSQGSSMGLRSGSSASGNDFSTDGFAGFNGGAGGKNNTTGKSGLSGWAWAAIIATGTVIAISLQNQAKNDANKNGIRPVDREGF